MSLLQTLTTGLRGVAGHRLRSILTTLGILFGVAAVICTVGIGRASADAVNARISSLGSNLLTVTPGSTRTAGVQGGLGSATSLTLADATAIEDRDNAPDVAAVAPVSQRNAAMAMGSNTWTSTVQATTPGWLTTSARTLADGRFLEDDDVSHRRQVAVLGTTTASQLGAGIGDVITIKGTPFTVVGLLATSGSQGFGNADDTAVIPFTTAQDLLLGGSSSVQRILLSASTSDTIGMAYEEVDNLLLNTHHAASPTAADFQITTQSQVLSTAQSVTDTLTILLASVAAISLLVGGIGVMNIMLVSVTERTGEIGLRKALGAAPGDLLRQFLVEAATLSIIGGLLGVGGGLLAGWLLPRFSTVAVTITWQPIVIAVAVSAGVGLIFGVYPAARASRLAPIEALRSQ